MEKTVCRSGGTTHPDLQTNTIHPLDDLPKVKPSPPDVLVDQDG